MNNNFKPENFFDLSNVSFADIFDNKKYVWDVLFALEDYVSELFKSEKIKPNYKKSKDVFIGAGTQVQSGVKIAGPAIIGKNCIISHVSLLRGVCLFGDNVRIGHACEIKNSIFLNGSVAAHFNYVGDSIIGNNVNISAGTVLANFRLDKRNVIVKADGKTIETGLRKFGSIPGDNSNIGVNAVLNPGTILGKNTIVYPLMLVKGVHQNNETIK